MGGFFIMSIDVYRYQ